MLDYQSIYQQVGCSIWKNMYRSQENYFQNIFQMLRKKPQPQLEPLKITKSEANYQALLLDMMSKLVTEQRESNRLLKKLVGEGESNCQSKLTLVSSPRKGHSNIRSLHLNTQEDKDHFQDNSSHISNYTMVSPDKSHFERNHWESSLQKEKENKMKKKIDTCLQEEKEKVGKQDKIQISKSLEGMTEILKRIQNNLSKPLVNTPETRLQVDEFNIFDSENISRKRIDVNKLQTLEHKTKRRKEARFSNITTLEMEKILDKPLIRSNKDNDKKNYSILSEILPYSDRRQIKIKISVEELMESYPGGIVPQGEVKKLTEQWLGMVYRATASICWNMLSNGLLTFQETKILFTQNIIFNFIEFMKAAKALGQEGQRFALAETINQTSVNILNFLCTQYPQTRIQDPNIALRSQIPSIDNKGRVKYDFIAKLCQGKTVSFRRRQNGDYTPEIMRAINFMIDRTNEQYEEFNILMTGLFGEIFLPIQKRRIQRTEETHEDQMYYEKVKSYTKFLVGRKINKNTPCYSQPQIQNGIFFVKSPSILRIITKWVQELDEMVCHPEAQIKNTQNQFKDHDGMPMHLFAQVKNGLYREIQRSQGQFQERVRRIKKQCYNLEVLLTMEQFTSQPEQTHLSDEQISVGKYCSYLKSAISSYICSQLNQAIHFLLSVPLRVDETRIGISEPLFQEQARKDLDNVNLVNFKIFDLLRCKCISKESQTVYLIKRLNQKSNDASDPFKIIRVKDRLSQGTRDILVNAQIRKGLVCEIQLAVTSNMDKKQELLDQYNHFLYELRRAKLGPITENASIWSALEQRATFFESLIRKKVVICAGQTPHPCFSNFQVSENRKVTKFPRPIICASCKNFFQIPRTCLLNIRCEQCGQTYCGECHYQHLGQNARKQYIFEKLYFHSFYPYIEQYVDFSKPFPRSGFIIRKLYLKKQLLYYKLISRHNDSLESVEEKQMELQLIVSVVEGKKIENKTLNRSPISAQLKNGELFIDQCSQEELSSFIVFSVAVGEDLEKTTLSYGDILKNFHQQKLKYINILKQPAYIEELKIFRKPKVIRKETAALKAILPSLDVPLTFLKLGKTVILVQIQVEENVLQAQLVKILNLGRLKAYAVDKCNSVSMEFRRLTDQMDSLPQKFSPELLASFSRRVTKLYLNFGEVRSLGFLQMLTNVKVLFLRSNLIDSLSGVEHLRSLVLICFDKNNVTSLQPLEGLTELTQISGSENRLVSLEGIGNLGKLKRLILYKNQIPKIEYTQKLILLRQFSFNHNPFDDVNPILHMGELQELSLGRSQLRNIQPLHIFTGLKKLALDGIKLGCIGLVFRNFDFLIKLCLSSNQIEKIQNLDEMIDLVQLNLKDNRITEIANLQNCVKLEVLRLQNNLITDISGIKNAESLQILQLQNNPLEDCSDMYFVDRKTFKLQVSSPGQSTPPYAATAEFYERLQAALTHKGNSSSSSSSSSSSESED